MAVNFDLTVIWAFIIAFAVFAYVVMDGFDLGIGILFPTFEVGPERVGKGGVVRAPELHAEVCERAKAWLESQGWQVLGIEESPILGPKGNAEFLIAARRDG